MVNCWGKTKKIGMLFALLLLFSGVALYFLVAGTGNQIPAFPGGDLFSAISCPSWDFKMDGVALSSNQGNGTELRLYADKIKSKPLKRGGITFINYSQLVVENARIKLSQVAGAKKGGEDDSTEFNAAELFNIFSDLAGGSKKYILGKKDLENGPLKTRITVKVTAFPLTIEIRTPGKRSVKIRAGHALAEMGRSEVLLSGGASVRLSGNQALCGQKIHCLGSLREFFVEGAYTFETEDDIIRGENGFFTIENGRLCLSDRKYCKTAKNGSLTPDQLFDTILFRAMANGRNSKSLKLFSRLFLGSFQPGFFGSHGGNPKVLNHSFHMNKLEGPSEYRFKIPAR